MALNMRLTFALFATIIVSSWLNANPMVTDTHASLKRIRSQVVHEAENTRKLMKLPSWLVKTGMTLVNYDSQIRSNAAIAKPFFIIDGAMKCLKDIGSTPEDIAYLQSVFTEFYGSNERTLYRLITILHRHMMLKLGLPETQTLDQFKNIMENTNKHGYPKLLTASQFVLYCRCVARGLYAVHWIKNGSI